MSTTVLLNSSGPRSDSAPVQKGAGQIAPAPIPDWRKESLRRAIEIWLPQPRYFWKESDPAPNSDMALGERQRGVAELLLSIAPEYMLPIRFREPLSSYEIRN